MIGTIQDRLDALGLTRGVIEYCKRTDTPIVRTVIAVYSLYYNHPDEATGAILSEAVKDCVKEMKDEGIDEAEYAPAPSGDQE